MPSPPARPRLADIAAEAGVSTATVSRVLNGKDVVTPETRQAVHRALDLLGYERPAARVRRQGLVGLVVPELTNPVFPALAQAVESLLAQAGFTPLLCTQSPGGTTEDEYIATLVAHEVDGIVFVSGMHADTSVGRGRYRQLRERGLPIVLVGGFAPEVDAPQVSTDEVTAARLAVRHLVALGHRRIGLALGPERFVPSRRKRAGFESALVTAGLAGGGPGAARCVASNLYSVEGGKAAAAELLAAGCTGLVCASDPMALGATRAARDRGLRVPGDVSVVGYDDSPFMAYADPPLTTVRQPVTALARLAVSLLVSEMRGERVTRAEILVEPELVVRASTGPPRRPAAGPRPWLSAGGAPARPAGR